MAVERHLFISHVHEEGPLAAALRRVLEGCLGGSKVWVSGDDIPAGRQWLEKLNEAMERADTVVVLCSARSTGERWVNFEAGGGWGKGSQVVPVCHSGMTLAGLPSPLNAFQGYQLSTRSDLARLVSGLGGVPPGDLDAAWADVESARLAIDYVPPATRPLPPPVAGRGVLVDLSHGQKAWPQQREQTIFSWPVEGLGGLAGDLEVGGIEEADQIRASDLRAWHGAIVALSFRTRMAKETIDEIVGWVRTGGRLVLLGYELGELHHGGNLNELAGRFALRFNGDIVAPADWQGATKPYGEDVVFESHGVHPLLDGVESVTWRNVQTIAREPGTQPLLTIGTNSVAFPTPTSVGFADGYLTMPKPLFEIELVSENVPVAAVATRHLTGKGRVVAIGTWDLLPEGTRSPGNTRFAANLLQWLTEDGI